ncbi:hypothetical protein GCM10010172_36970 [Paractinoplanes ferrugineus]|uniref:Uncharacterized protein n=1 Tax=Paractinoplanes ferrugineus TaxID=113564 RepID=A0A919IYY1_9ACTN|nr:hypothetical protein [Actinoplanes ferrugineus]GIE09294.1 hypothetical protein Afe05nite_11340 [Actinoplanes ferrugineus]
MPLELGEGTATLIGVVTVDEVEELAGWLRATTRPKVNLRRCNHLHTGAFQALLLFRPKVSAAPTDSFLAERVLPLLARQGSEPP